MRLSEKTIELTFCHQIGNFIRRDIIWFGLTQKQEMRAGFDACTKLGGRLLILQFKASNKSLKKTGARQFKAQHHQMLSLQRICRGHRGVYYVFPLTGNTKEISMNPNILDNTWFLDVNDLPDSIFPPTTTRGDLRKSGIHYINVLPGTATIHSDPFEVKLKNKMAISNEIREDSGSHRFGIDINEIQKSTIGELHFQRGCLGGVILP